MSDSFSFKIARKAIVHSLHRVMVACRDGRLYSIKEGDVRGTAVLTGNVIDLGAQAIAMAREDKVGLCRARRIRILILFSCQLTWVATTDRTISCYTTRYKYLMLF